jgi:hypothetical protein
VVEAPAAAALPPNLTEAEAWHGFEVDDVKGAGIGRVRGLFVDAESGEPAWLIVAPRRRFSLFGRRGASLVVVPLRDCAAATGRAWMAHPGEAVRAAPTVDPTRPLLREHELTICAHYGIGERVGRAVEVLNRPEGAVTAQPSTR